MNFGYAFLTVANLFYGVTPYSLVKYTFLFVHICSLGAPFRLVPELSSSYMSRSAYCWIFSGFWLGLPSNPEDESSRLIRNIGKLLAQSVVTVRTSNILFD